MWSYIIALSRLLDKHVQRLEHPTTCNKYNNDRWGSNASQGRFDEFKEGQDLSLLKEKKVQ